MTDYHPDDAGERSDNQHAREACEHAIDANGLAEHDERTVNIGREAGGGEDEP